MLPGQVAATRTPLDAPTLAAELANAWRAELGTEPRPDQLAVLLAQSALETGRWRSCYNWNLGNLKAGSAAPSWYAVRCSEILNGREVFFDPPHPACRFVAYPSRREGVAAYWRLMRQRFRSAWPFVEAGDPRGFVHALKAARYFTAAEQPYADAVKKLHREYAQQLGGETPPAPPSRPPPVLAAASPLVILGPLVALGLSRALARTGETSLVHAVAATGCSVPIVTWFGYGREKAGDLDRLIRSLVEDATRRNRDLSPGYLRGLSAWAADWRAWYSADRGWWAWNTGGTLDKLCRVEDDLTAWRAELVRQTGKPPSMLPDAKDDPLTPRDAPPGLLAAVPIAALAAALLAGGYLVRSFRR